MYPHILKNYLNFNYGRSYEGFPILKKKIYQSNGKKKGKGLKNKKLRPYGIKQQVILKNLYILQNKMIFNLTFIAKFWHSAENETKKSESFNHSHIIYLFCTIL